MVSIVLHIVQVPLVFALDGRYQALNCCIKGLLGWSLCTPLVRSILEYVGEGVAHGYSNTTGWLPRWVYCVAIFGEWRGYRQ